MKNILLKLLPGVLACMAVTIGINWSRAQSVAGTIATFPNGQPPVERPTLMGQAQPAAVAYATQPAPQYIVCGHCGAQIAAPQAVWIAAPVAGGERRGAPLPGQSFYGIPPVGFVQDYAAAPGCYIDPYRRGADEQRFDLPAPRRFYR